MKYEIHGFRSWIFFCVNLPGSVYIIVNYILGLILSIFVSQKSLCIQYKKRKPPKWEAFSFMHLSCFILIG